jgi:hypothetical protein
MLRWVVRLRLERDITPGPVAGRPGKILRRGLFQLTLALLGRLLRHGQLGGFLGPTLPLPFPITPALLTPKLLPLWCRSITASRLPALPVAGSLPARPTTIATQRMKWLEGPFALLQQAPTQPPAA